MHQNANEPRFEVSYDDLIELEKRARRERDQYMAACLRAGYHRVRDGVAAVAEGLTARTGGNPRQA